MFFFPPVFSHYWPDNKGHATCAFHAQPHCLISFRPLPFGLKSCLGEKLSCKGSLGLSCARFSPLDTLPQKVLDLNCISYYLCLLGAVLKLLRGLAFVSACGHHAVFLIPFGTGLAGAAATCWCFQAGKRLSCGFGNFHNHDALESEASQTHTANICKQGVGLILLEKTFGWRCRSKWHFSWGRCHRCQVSPWRPLKAPAGSWKHLQVKDVKVE